MCYAMTTGLGPCNKFGAILCLSASEIVYIVEVTQRFIADKLWTEAARHEGKIGNELGARGNFFTFCFLVLPKLASYPGLPSGYEAVKRAPKARRNYYSHR